MMKGITPIIAIIVLLLITVALAGVAWSYLQGYMGGLTSKSIEVRDYFCITGDMPVIVVANIGTDAITTATDITVLNSATGALAVGTWRPMSGTGTTASIAVNDVARWESSTACSTGTCSFRVTAGGRAQRISVTC
jgi:flagellin-like protein